MAVVFCVISSPRSVHYFSVKTPPENTLILDLCAVLCQEFCTLSCGRYCWSCYRASKSKCLLGTVDRSFLFARNVHY